MSLARSSLFFAAGTLLSRITGLLRDRALLSVFGTSELMSAFVIAFRIPNLLREMLAEGALGSSFTKIYTSLDTKDPLRAQRLLIDALILMTVVCGFVCSLGILAAPLIVELMTAESESGPVLISTATGLTRILFPFLGFMALGAIVAGALHKKGSFFASASGPVVFNLCNIAGALYFAPLLERYGGAWIEEYFAPKSITGLAFGVLLGGLGQVLFQSYDLRREIREGFRARRAAGWSFPWSPDIKQVVVLMAPMALASGGGQVKTVINNYFATSQGPSAVVWLDSAFRLLHLPVGLFGIAIGSAVLPSLSRALAKADGFVNQEASSEIQRAGELVLWLMTPCFIFLLVHHLDLVRCLYESGRFTPHDSLETSRALFAYSFAAISYGLGRVITSFYFAFERTNFALGVSLGNIVLNLVANWLMIDRFGHVGLAWGYSLTQGVSLVPMIWGMRQHGIQIQKNAAMRSFICLGISALVSLMALGALRDYLLKEGSFWLSPFGPLPQWASLGILLASSGLVLGLISVGSAMIAWQKSPRQLFTLIRSKLRRKK